MNVFFYCVNILLLMTLDFGQIIHSLFVIYQENIIQLLLNSITPKTVPSKLLDSSNENEWTEELDEYNIPTPPLTLSPSLSTSSTPSVSSFNSNWSLERHSKVEEMIRLFECNLPERRYSVDSYSHKKTLIRQRKFDYTPIVGEWKRRELKNAQPCPCPSKSTPVTTSKRNQSLF